jgi:isopenicillin-N epimerase
LPGGWPQVMRTNHELALRARDVLLERLGVRAPAPDGMIGSMAAIPLPMDAAGTALDTQALHDWLRARGVEAWLHPNPVPLVRVSAQLYNRLDQFRHLAVLLEEALRECRP